MNLERQSTYLQADSDFSIGQSHQHVGHLGIASWRYKAATQNITSGSIEPSGDCYGQ
jgi:predicted secreted protein